MRWESMAQQAPQLGDAYEALFAAKRALEGLYPWWVHKAYSAKAARECAHRLIVAHLEDWGVHCCYRGIPR